MLEQCKATVSYMVMAWTVNNTVAHHINNKVDNKLVKRSRGPGDARVLLYILQTGRRGFRMEQGLVCDEQFHEPLDVAALHK